MNIRQNPKPINIFRILLNIIIVGIVFLIMPFIINSCDSKKDSIDEKYKKESELARDKKNTTEKYNAGLNEVKARYKYLEKKKIKGKKSAKAFIDEISKLGFELYENNKSDPFSRGVSYEEFVFKKQEGGFTVKIYVTEYSDGDVLITVD